MENVVECNKRNELKRAVRSSNAIGAWVGAWADSICEAAAEPVNGTHGT